MSSTSTSATHLHFLRVALDEARKCDPTPTAFCVGSVFTASFTDSSESVIISRGYSRELPGNTHAEANALTKARCLSAEELKELFPGAPEGLTIDDMLRRADVYTTMEPCSVRTSGLAPCADALIAAKIRRCIIGVGEPDDFVQCEGARKLVDAGIEVVWVQGLERECLEVARTGHDRTESE